MEITTVGLDVAKRVFQVHGVDAHGKVVVRKQLRRKEVVAYFTQLPACEIGMEAGSSSHYWARRLQGLGHRVKLMAPQFVRPYVKTNKNDARDAEAICEAGPLYSPLRARPRSGSTGQRIGAADSPVAQEQRAESQVGESAGHWPDYGQCPCGHHR